MAFHVILNRGIEELLVGGVDLIVIFGVHHVEVGHPLFFIKHGVWVIHLGGLGQSGWVCQIGVFELLWVVEPVLAQSGGLVEVLLDCPQVLP